MLLKHPNFTELVKEMKRAKILGDAQEYLLLHRILGSGINPFDVLDGSKVIDARGSLPEAHLKVRVNGDIYEITADGGGLINAFDLALRQALLIKYPQVDGIVLKDYQVSLPKREGGTAAEVEVFVELATNGNVWNSRVRGTDQQRAGEDAIADAYKYWILAKFNSRI